MSYISDIFDRADLQHIREFLVNGTECAVLDHDTYQKRLEKAQEAALEMIKANFPDTDEDGPIIGKLYYALGVYQDVYMEIGLKVGIMLAVQFLKGDFTNDK